MITTFNPFIILYVSEMFNLDIEKIKEDNEELFEILKKERILEEELI
jgi:hypothetical protein